VVESPPLPPDPDDVEDVAEVSVVLELVLEVTPVLDIVELALLDDVALAPALPSLGASMASSNSHAGPKTSAPARPARANHPAPTLRMTRYLLRTSTNVF
jgi:hypothetical protein